jgi:hypothetical protein
MLWSKVQLLRPRAATSGGHSEAGFFFVVVAAAVVGFELCFDA